MSTMTRTPELHPATDLPQPRQPRRHPQPDDDHGLAGAR